MSRLKLRPADRFKRVFVWTVLNWKHTGAAFKHRLNRAFLLCYGLLCLAICAVNSGFMALSAAHHFCYEQPPAGNSERFRLVRKSISDRHSSSRQNTKRVPTSPNRRRLLCSGLRMTRWWHKNLSHFWQHINQPPHTTPSKNTAHPCQSLSFSTTETQIHTFMPSTMDSSWRINRVPNKLQCMQNSSSPLALL